MDGVEQAVSATGCPCYEWHCREFAVVWATQPPAGMKGIMSLYLRHDNLALPHQNRIMGSAFLSRCYLWPSLAWLT
jgi:hypothetical protein